VRIVGYAAAIRLEDALGDRTAGISLKCRARATLSRYGVLGDQAPEVGTFPSLSAAKTCANFWNLVLSTHVRNYGDVFGSSSQSQLFGGYPGQKVVKITASEGPFERGSRPLIVVLEGKKTVFKFGQRTEVVGVRTFLCTIEK